MRMFNDGKARTFHHFDEDVEVPLNDEFQCFGLQTLNQLGIVDNFHEFEFGTRR